MLYVNIGLKKVVGVVPKSTSVARERFRKLYTDNKLSVVDIYSSTYRKMNNEAEPDFPEVVDIKGQAGTLIIFDTDTFHHAGAIKNGHERKILRAHSGPEISYKEIPLKSRQWWRGERKYLPSKET